MAEKESDIQSVDELEERRDLRNTLIVGVVGGLLGFGPMILISGPVANVLMIPTLELTLVALGFVLVTIGGLIALQKNWCPYKYISWSALIIYTLLISLIVYFTGAPLTPMFALYLLVAAVASFLLGLRGAIIIAILSMICYALILWLEFVGVLPVIRLWRLSFYASTRGNLLIINWLAVTIPTLLTASLTGTLAERLKTANIHLRESERLRDNLTHMIVHDLRNPLTALIGGLDMLRLIMETKMDDSQLKLLKTTRHSGDVLLGMVNELLDISKMEAGKLELNIQSVNLPPLIEEVVDPLRAQLKMQKLNVKIEMCDDSLTVPCDIQLIRRVIANLMTNAMKHTPPRGTISLTTCRLDDDSIKVNISDTGIGIPPEHLGRIFEKFGQVTQPGSARRGTGLGLTFCKMAVEAHNGKIWVESEVNKGSTFSFTLPAEVPETE